LAVTKNRRTVFSLSRKSATNSFTLAKVASNPDGILAASVRQNHGGVKPVFFCVGTPAYLLRTDDCNLLRSQPQQERENLGHQGHLKSFAVDSRCPGGLRKVGA